jgi:hypothetical protein
MPFLKADMAHSVTSNDLEYNFLVIYIIPSCTHGTKKKKHGFADIYTYCDLLHCIHIFNIRNRELFTSRVLGQVILTLPLGFTKW